MALHFLELINTHTYNISAIMHTCKNFCKNVACICIETVALFTVYCLRLPVPLPRADREGFQGIIHKCANGMAYRNRRLSTKIVRVVIKSDNFIRDLINVVKVRA